VCPEWNIAADVSAARIALSARFKATYLVPLDISWDFRLPEELLSRRTDSEQHFRGEGSDLLRTILRFEGAFLAAHPEQRSAPPVLYDAVAALVAEQVAPGSQLTDFVTRRCSLEVSDDGSTVASPGGPDALSYVADWRSPTAQDAARQDLLHRLSKGRQ